MLFQTLLFLAFTLVCGLALLGIHRFKKVSYKSLLGLFLFGILISAPFILIEYLHLKVKFYLVVMAFLSIELAILFLEQKVEYFHHLVHHNIKHLRLISFFLIGLGFTYSEISFTIFHTVGDWQVLAGILPFKAVYALLMHTLFASAVSLINLGNLFAETIYETVFKLVGYYVRIALISLSHYLYTLSLNHDFLYLMLFLSLGVGAFFYVKKKLDQRMNGKKISNTHQYFG